MSKIWGDARRWEKPAEEVVPEELYADLLDSNKPSKPLSQLPPEKMPGFRESQQDSSTKKRKADVDVAELLAHRGRAALPDMDNMIGQMAGTQASTSHQSHKKGKPSNHLSTWKQAQGGIAALAGRFTDDNRAEAVADREEQEMFDRHDDDFKEYRMPHGPVGDFDFHNTEVTVAVDKPLSSSNIGFKMMQKMGWKEGTGMGKKGTGIVNPIGTTTSTTSEPAAASAVPAHHHTTMGLGKQEEYDKTAEQATANRKAHDAEKTYTAEEQMARQIRAAKERIIEEDVKAAKEKFFCKVCGKGYDNLQDWDSHLISTAHHHRARMAETRKHMMALSRGGGEKQEKQKDKAAKREAREMAKMRAAQIAAEQKSMSNSSTKAASVASIAPASRVNNGVGGWSSPVVTEVVATPTDPAASKEVGSSSSTAVPAVKKFAFGGMTLGLQKGKKGAKGPGVAGRKKLNSSFKFSGADD